MADQATVIPKSFILRTPSRFYQGQLVLGPSAFTALLDYRAIELAMLPRRSASLAGVGPVHGNRVSAATELNSANLPKPSEPTSTECPFRPTRRLPRSGLAMRRKR